MEGPEGSGAAKHVRKAATINVDDVAVHLSPEMTRMLARIEAAVHNSKDFSPEILENLQEYANGKPFSSARMAFSGIATITQETMRHAIAAGDQRAEEALDDFINQFYEEEEKGTPSFILVPLRVKGR